jgi:hypothetical protein
MRHFLKSLIVIVAVLVVSCDSSEETGPIDVGQDYFPLKKGLYQIYDIDEINYVLGVPETLEYELKTHVVDSFLTLDGEYKYVIHRSKRDSGTDDWTYLDTWSAQANNHEAVMSEENTSFLKLIFPVAKGVEWDGNKYNTGEADDYALEEVKVAYNFNDTSFEDCITVVQADDPDPIVFFDVRNEIYARNVGLIHRELTQLYYCDDPDCLGKQEVESGRIYKQTIKSYGME